MAIKLKAKETLQRVGDYAGTYRFVLNTELYNKLSESKVIREAALRSGISKGIMQACWDAAGEVIKAWATEGHSVAIPGLGTMRFGVRAKSVESVDEVASSLITTRRVIFTPNVDIKNELKATSISITCYDRNGDVIKSVTSDDDGDVEEENDPSAGSGTGENGGDNTQKKTVTLTVTPVGAGTVTGGGQYDSGASVNIGATAASGYHFVKWNDNSTSANRTLNVLDSDIDLQAIFEADTPEDENPGGDDEGGMANY